MSGAVERVRRLMASNDELERLAAVAAARDEVGDRDAGARLLIEMLDDCGPLSYVPGAARAVLQEMGPEAVPALVAGLSAESVRRRGGCAWALAAPRSETASRVAQALTATAGDAEVEVRHAVAAALGRIGCAATEATAPLVALSRDAASRVRLAALHSLGRLSTIDESAEAALLSGLDDGAPVVREAAVTGLRRVPVTPERVARARQALDEEPEAHLHAPLRALLEVWGA